MKFTILLIAAVIFSLLPLFNQSIRLDEAQSLWVSTRSVPGILKYVSEDVHVPLYSLLLHFWLQIFGTNIQVARALSVLFYLLTLPVLYKLFKEISTPGVAKVAVTLFALSPFVTWYSLETRMYTLFTLVAALCHLFYIRVVGSEGRHGKLGYLLTLMVGYYTHYFFFFLVATQFIYSLGQLILENTKRTFLTVIGLMATALIPFLPWAYYVIRSGTAANTQPLIPPPTSYNIFQTLTLFFFGFQSQFLQGLLVSLWPLLVVLLFFVFTQKRDLPSRFSAYMMTMSTVPLILVFIASFVRPIFLPRYLIFIIPTLFYLIALLIMNYQRKVALVLVGGLLLAMSSLLIYQNTSASTPVKEDYQGVSHYLSEQTQPQDIIAVTAPFTIYPIEYAYTGHTRIDTIPQWDRYTQGAIPPYDEQKVAQQIEEYRKKYARMFVVFSYDQGYEEKLKLYLDTHLERTDLKTFSPNLELRVYKLRYDINP